MKANHFKNSKVVFFSIFHFVILHHSRITSTRLSYLAEQIQRLFPSEDKSIYFTPFHTEINKKGQKIRSAAGGKLLHHYNYVKGQLLKWKVLVPPSKSGETSTSLSNDDENENENNETEHLQWLMSGHIEPLSEILVRWKSSFKERRSTSALRLNNEYVITYPCFQIYPAELVRIFDLSLLELYDFPFFTLLVHF